MISVLTRERRNNMVPDKIYLQQYDTDTVISLNKYNIDEEWTEVPLNAEVAKDIEYIRKDALIKWFNDNIKSLNVLFGEIFIARVKDKLNSM